MGLETGPLKRKPEFDWPQNRNGRVLLLYQHYRVRIAFIQAIHPLNQLGTLRPNEAVNYRLAAIPRPAAELLQPDAMLTSAVQPGRNETKPRSLNHLLPDVCFAIHRLGKIFWIQME